MVIEWNGELSAKRSERIVSARLGARLSCQYRLLLIFQAIVTSVHSPCTAAKPRNKNCRKRITDLIMPNTGSTVCLRKP